MPSNMPRGWRKLLERHIDSQPKLNGNMQRAEASKQSTGGATSFNQAWPIAKIVPTSLPPSNRSRLAALSQIRLDCTIWVAASISGSRTAGTKTTRVRRRTVQHGSKANAPHMSSDLVLGKMMHDMPGHRTET